AALVSAHRLSIRERRSLGCDAPDRSFLDGVRRRTDAAAMSRVGRAAAWTLPFGLLVVSIVSVPLGILDEEGLPRYRALRAELAEVERVNERLRREVEQLQREVDALRN